MTVCPKGQFLKGGEIMIKKLAIVGVAAALFAASTLPALAHPADPSANPGQVAFVVPPHTCTIFPVGVHDLDGNVYPGGGVCNNGEAPIVVFIGIH